jgi:bacterioferritin-associated ferredoxin
LLGYGRTSLGGVVLENHRAMIVCACNVSSDRDFSSAVEAEQTRSTARSYGCLGCNAQCGRRARTIRRLMEEALVSAREASDKADGLRKARPKGNTPRPWRQ